MGCKQGNLNGNESYYLSDVQQDVHEVLEGGGDVSASETCDILAHVATKDLVEWSGFFAGIVKAFDRARR